MNAVADRYARLREEAAVLAGTPADIRRRAALLHQVFHDSGGNHAFAEIAAHGALWAFGFFETTGTLGRVISYRYLHHRAERRRRHAMLQGFADGFKEANRSVFIDTYSQYHLAAGLDDPAEAAEVVGDDVGAALATICVARRAGRRLDREVRRDLFKRVLRREQTVTVGPKVDAEFEKFDCPVLRAVVMKPPVRFAYFPRWKYFWFRDFRDTEERVRRAHACFDLGERAGWPRVFASMAAYRVLPAAFFADPPAFAADLKRRLLAGDPPPPGMEPLPTG